jgi:hypothetical protein
MLIEHIPFDMQPISPRQRRRSRPPTACFHSCRRDPRAEYALDYILERKSVQDLLSSIKEERYERQKARAAPLACRRRRVYECSERDRVPLMVPTSNSCLLSPRVLPAVLPQALWAQAAVLPCGGRPGHDTRW